MVVARVLVRIVPGTGGLLGVGGFGAGRGGRTPGKERWGGTELHTQDVNETDQVVALRGNNLLETGRIGGTIC